MAAQSKSQWPKRILLTLGILLLAGVIYLGPLVMTAVRAGFLERQPERVHKGDVEANLKAIHRALMLYADSEGVLPQAKGWMDAAWIRLKTADMKEAEAKKFLQSSTATKPEEFGLAMNEALSGKDPYAEKKQDQILIFESAGYQWNASGDPRALAHKTGGKGITLEGEILSLKP